MEGDWMLAQLQGKEKTDKASGCKLWFEEEQKMLFGTTLTVRHREQFGTLTLTQNGKAVLKCEGKLIKTDKYPKAKDKTGLSKFQFVPTTRLEPKAFSKLYGLIGTTMEASWRGEYEGQNDAGDGRPYADDETDGDEHVIPGSTAAHMKASARKKVAAGT